MFHERHRIFPALFEERKHKKIIDISAGIGAVANRVNKYYNADIICNELSPKCIDSLQELGLKTMSFDLDDKILNHIHLKMENLMLLFHWLLLSIFITSITFSTNRKEY